MSRIVVSFVALCAAMAAGAIELSDSQRAAIEERIKPMGEVCLQGRSHCQGHGRVA
mgnify:CR=1 FL=1